MKDFQDLIQKDKTNIDKVKKDNQDIMLQFENMQKELRNIQTSKPNTKS